MSSPDGLSFEVFGQMASRVELDEEARIGFPGLTRRGHEQAIFRDIRRKIPNINVEGARVLDIGSGWSRLTRLLVDHCKTRSQQLLLNDHPRVLSQIPPDPNLKLLSGRFPDEVLSQLEPESIDVVICYSVIQYVFADSDWRPFLDAVALIMRSGSTALIGDIPNATMRNRYFRSQEGRRAHHENYPGMELPIIDFKDASKRYITDRDVLEMVQHLRDRGLQTFILPQDPLLPFAKRREDMVLHAL